MSILLKKDFDTLEAIKEFVENYDNYYLGRNQWFYGNSVNIYIRNTHRHYEGEYLRTVEIANVSVLAPYRGLGVYRDLLNFMFGITPIGAALFIENVVDEDHYIIYTSRNFSAYGKLSEGNASFLKIRLE